MRHCVWHTTVLAVFLGLFVSCSQKSEDTAESRALREEVKSLREELARQKASSAPSVTSTHAVVARAVSAPSSPEFTEFLRVSRRMVSAMGTGVSYADFGQRLVDINASAEEVLPKISHPAQKAKIADFVIALHDAFSLWRYKIGSESDRMPIESISGEYAYPSGFPQELGDRWNSNFPDLIKRYGLDDKKDDIVAPIMKAVGSGGYKPHLFFDRGLQHIFEYATTTFREIEKTER